MTLCSMDHAVAHAAARAKLPGSSDLDAVQDGSLRLAPPSKEAIRYTEKDRIVVIADNRGY